MRAIITRHYKTQFNADNLIIGWDDSPACPDSIADIDFIESRLQQNGIAIERIFSRALERSRQSARIYAERFGLDGITESPQLNEIKYGKVQKQKKSWAAKFYPEQKKNPDLAYPHGESFREMQTRSLDYFNSVIDAYPQETVLLVIHAGVIRGFINHFLGLNYAENLEHKIPFRYIGDFLFEDGRCRAYDELGKDSGFVGKGIIDIPIELSVSD